MIFVLFRFWGAIFVPLMVLVYLSSGAIVGTANISEEVLWWMWFNPLFHCVEWFRSAFYEGYDDELLSRTYIFAFATFWLFLGLLGERGLRGRLLVRR
jgi:capsular polysaccharide transport system permease protein